MYGGIHREDKAEDQKPHDQKNCKPRGGSTRDQRGKGQHERHRHEETGPEDRLVDRLSLGLSFAPQQARCETLHNAIGDDPERHQAADKEKGLTTVATKLFINDNGLAKLVIALAKGKKIYDKRATIKEKDLRRELDRGE